MDSLGENLTDILYGRKMVCISLLGRNPFSAYSDKSKVRSIVITITKARRCLSKGCSAFVEYVNNVKKEKRAMN